MGDDFVDTREILRFTLNLLDLSAADKQPFKPHFERVPMLPLIHAVLDSMEIRAKTAGVQLHTNGSAPTSTLDPRIFRRILANLIDHAILRAPSGTDVEIRMTAEPSGAVLLRIIDSGPSVPPSHFDAALRRPPCSPSRVTRSNVGRGRQARYSRLRGTLQPLLKTRQRPVPAVRISSTRTWPPPLPDAVRQCRSILRS